MRIQLTAERFVICSEEEKEEEVYSIKHPIKSSFTICLQSISVVTQSKKTCSIKHLIHHLSSLRLQSVSAAMAKLLSGIWEFGYLGRVILSFITTLC